eukprot:1359850-Amorphochlora_amoeboformis.AAC.2
MDGRILDRNIGPGDGQGIESIEDTQTRRLSPVNKGWSPRGGDRFRNLATKVLGWGRFDRFYMSKTRREGQGDCTSPLP